MRLAYADPPYPGKSYLYRENQEVDHVELISKLREYDGWALSTDEKNLALVLALCPPRTRVLAWCIKNPPPLHPYPYAAWEPVLCMPARTKGEPVPTFVVAPAQSGFRSTGLTGSKPREFCEWLIRCLGAERGDSLDDLFPGTGAVTEAWERFQRQTSIFERPAYPISKPNRENRLRRWNDPLPGVEPASNRSEGNGRNLRRKVDAA